MEIVNVPKIVSRFSGFILILTFVSGSRFIGCPKYTDYYYKRINLEKKVPGLVTCFRSPIGGIRYRLSPIGGIRYRLSPMGDIRYRPIGRKSTHENKHSTRSITVKRNTESRCTAIILIAAQTFQAKALRQ